MRHPAVLGGGALAAANARREVRVGDLRGSRRSSRVTCAENIHSGVSTVAARPTSPPVDVTSSAWASLNPPTSQSLGPRHEGLALRYLPRALSTRQIQVMPIAPRSRFPAAETQQSSPHAAHLTLTSSSCSRSTRTYTVPQSEPEPQQHARCTMYPPQHLPAPAAFASSGPSPRPSTVGLSEEARVGSRHVLFILGPPRSPPRPTPLCHVRANSFRANRG